MQWIRKEQLSYIALQQHGLSVQGALQFQIVTISLLYLVQVLEAGRILNELELTSLRHNLS